MIPGFPQPKFFLNKQPAPLTEDEQGRPDPTTADGNKERADEHLAKGRVHNAITCYKKAARLDNSAEHRTDLGDAYAYAELPVNAVKQYRRALKSNPKCPDAHFSIAEMYTRYGRWHAAAIEYGKAVELDSENSFYRYKYACALTQMSCTHEAIAQMEEVVLLRPRDGFYRFVLAGLYAEVQRHDDAVGEMEYAVRLCPEDDYYHARLGMLYARAGKLDHAARMYDEASRLNPERLAYRCLVGDMLDWLGDEELAKSAYAEAAEIDAYDTEFVHRARRYMLGGTW